MIILNSKYNAGQESKLWFTLGSSVLFVKQPWICQMQQDVSLQGRKYTAICLRKQIYCEVPVGL